MGLGYLVAGSSFLQTSSDLLTWKNVPVPDEMGLPLALGWNGALWVATTADGIWTSPNGTRWTHQPSDMDRLADGSLEDQGVKNVRWLQDQWVAVGNWLDADGNPRCLATSPDGVHWTSRATPSDSSGFRSLYDVARGHFADVGDVYVAVGFDDNGVLIDVDDIIASTDGGVTWFAVTDGVGIGQFLGPIHGSFHADGPTHPNAGNWVPFGSTSISAIPDDKLTGSPSNVENSFGWGLAPMPPTRQPGPVTFTFSTTLYNPGGLSPSAWHAEVGISIKGTANVSSYVLAVGANAVSVSITVPSGSADDVSTDTVFVEIIADAGDNFSPFNPNDYIQMGVVTIEVSSWRPFHPVRVVFGGGVFIVSSSGSLGSASFQDYARSLGINLNVLDSDGSGGLSLTPLEGIYPFSGDAPVLLAVNSTTERVVASSGAGGGAVFGPRVLETNTPADLASWTSAFDTDASTLVTDLEFLNDAFIFAGLLFDDLTLLLLRDDAGVWTRGATYFTVGDLILVIGYGNIEFAVPPLRFRQRDDGLDGGGWRMGEVNAPSSMQRSLRAYPSGNTYA